MSDLNNPYLLAGRLGDVISAIQVMGSHENFLGRPAFWAERITGSASNADACEKLFLEHREFFRRYDVPRNNNHHYSLIWRHSLPYIDKRTGLQMTHAEYEAEKGKGNIGRRELRPEEMKLLIDIAITMHSRAIDQSRDWRWWVAPALSLAGSFVGAILAFAASALFKGTH